MFTGSPPPMRGKGRFSSSKLLLCGITPAYAGKSFFVISIVRSIEDHPRLCGEKSRFRCSRRRHKGSPPPMRGKGVRPVRAPADLGITPAYAGKSILLHLTLYNRQDHPRLCGEKLIA